jgi:FMN-dependent oxidoreductase (nitrilotriacetate monooxygenase family)
MSDKQIFLSAFHLASPNHSWPGLWRHPRDRSLDYTSLGYWTDLARLLERGKFDTLFLADSLGVHDIYGGSPDSALRHGVQVPKHEPTVLVSAMAAVTEHLGFGVTANVSFEPPYLHARRFSTLDHLTNGRVGWNVVTGHQESGAKALGHGGLREHDERYDVADEYMDVVYKLWEGSWDDDAIRHDRHSGTLVDPSRVRPIRHVGKYFTVDGIHLSEPSPQRTPLIFQAGSSGRGRDFAGRHAETIFISGSGKAHVRDTVADLRARAKAEGRDPGDLRIIASATVIAGATRAEAVEAFEDSLEHVSRDGMLTLLSGWTGIDFSTYSPDDPLRDIQTNAIQSTLKALVAQDPERDWRVKDLVQFARTGGRGIFIVGSGAEVAEQLIGWVDDTGLDGFNLIRVVVPETIEGIVDHVVPELQARGRYKLDYAPGTLREKVFGAGRARLPATHHAARFRQGAAL